MNKSYYNITLDIKSMQSQISLPVKQGDTNRGVRISLTDGVKPYTIGRNCFAMFNGKKFDGTEIVDNCIIQNNKIEYLFTEELVRSAGVINCEIALYGADGKQITSASFTLIVDPRAAFGSVQDESITEEDLQDGCVTSDKIKDGSVTSDKIKDGSVTSDKLQDGSITSAKVEDRSLLRKDFKLGEAGFITPEDFGAVGDGVTDDYEALQAAVNESIAKGLYVKLTKKYITSKPILLKSKAHIFGGTVKKTTNTTVNITDPETGKTHAVNGVFVINGSFVCIENCQIGGTTEELAENDGVSGIVFGAQAIMFRIARVQCVKCYNGLLDRIMCFMGTFENVNCQSCINGFRFPNAIKTSLTFKNCWAENCGQAWYFKSLQYSTLLNCGADYCNQNHEKNKYETPIGDKATGRGVYYFELSRNVSMINCGTEQCYGAGAVELNASMVNIDGLTVVELKSEYDITKSVSRANCGLGVITTTQDRSSFTVKNLDVTGFYNDNLPVGELCVIGYNCTKGVPDGVDATLINYNVPTFYERDSDGEYVLDENGERIPIMKLQMVKGLNEAMVKEHFMNITTETFKKNNILTVDDVDVPDEEYTKKFDDTQVYNANAVNYLFYEIMNAINGMMG